ncbi:hypothetical protein STEG23_017253 [Scotinomys teguina]
MRQDEVAADGALRPGAVGSEAADAEDEAGDDDADLLDTSDPAGGGESAASPEELEDEGAEGGGAARRRGAKTCTYEGCRETTSQVAKQRKPWMCKKHRNKMYKDKYKKKKSDQALGSGGASAASASNVKLEESTDNILSIVKQRTGSFGDRPARPTLLEQVLNQKRLSLLRSPEVVQFLQKQQQLLNQQVLEQRQQRFPGAPVVDPLKCTVDISTVPGCAYSDFRVLESLSSVFKFNPVVPSKHMELNTMPIRTFPFYISSSDYSLRTLQSVCLSVTSASSCECD